jgi:hypothetical protein
MKSDEPSNNDTTSDQLRRTELSKSAFQKAGTD